MKKIFVPLDRAACLKCAYLVTTEKVFRDDCPSLSTDSCPAVAFQIGVSMNMDKASSAIAEALYEGDVLRLQRCVNKLAEYPPTDGAAVLDKVFDKTAALYGIEVGDAGDADSDGEGAGSDQAGQEDLDETGDLGVMTDSGTSEAQVVLQVVAVDPPLASKVNADNIKNDTNDEDSDLVPSLPVAPPVVNAVPVAAISVAAIVETPPGAEPTSPVDDEWTDGGQP